MKILILNGITDDPNYLDYEKQLESSIKANTNIDTDIQYFKLRDLNIHYCTGCWDCWLKTPGICAIKDDQEEILSAMPHADKILFVSPILVGYESSLLKRTKDRIIPYAHPYIEIYNGEQHHRQRYPHSPDFSVLLIKDELTEDCDLDVIKSTYERVALNFKTTLQQFEAVDTIGGIDHVITNFKR